MKKTGYLILVFTLWCSIIYGQIEVKQFNAGWNNANDVPWVMDLEDCTTIGYTDIASNASEHTEYKKADVPTI